jgi:hypothetical protein
MGSRASMQDERKGSVCHCPESNSGESTKPISFYGNWRPVFLLQGRSQHAEPITPQERSCDTIAQEVGFRSRSGLKSKSKLR